MALEFKSSFKDAEQGSCIQLSPKSRNYLKVKRLFDFFLSLCGLIALSPVFLIVAAAVKVDDPTGSIFYKQIRVGRNGVPFTLYKFRSMRMGTPEPGTHEFTNTHFYVTKVGKFIWKTSIDELPQLWNVLIGNMSLIGPRPLLEREKNVHQQRFRRGIYQVRPGITGLAQTRGRDDMDDDVKVHWDSIYVQKLSLNTDFYIFIQTVVKVLKHEGVLEGEELAKEKAGQDQKAEETVQYSWVSSK